MTSCLTVFAGSILGYLWHAAKVKKGTNKHREGERKGERLVSDHHTHTYKSACNVWPTGGDVLIHKKKELDSVHTHPHTHPKGV